MKSVDISGGDGDSISITGITGTMKNNGAPVAPVSIHINQDGVNASDITIGPNALLEADYSSITLDSSGTGQIDIDGTGTPAISVNSSGGNVT